MPPRVKIDTARNFCHQAAEAAQNPLVGSVCETGAGAIIALGGSSRGAALDQETPHIPVKVGREKVLGKQVAVKVAEGGELQTRVKTRPKRFCFLSPPTIYRPIRVRIEGAIFDRIPRKRHLPESPVFPVGHVAFYMLTCPKKMQTTMCVATMCVDSVSTICCRKSEIKLSLPYEQFGASARQDPRIASRPS